MWNVWIGFVASTVLIFRKHIFCKIYGHTLYRFYLNRTKNVKYMTKFHLHLKVKCTFHCTTIHETQIAQIRCMEMLRTEFYRNRIKIL
jgi:hypothetical protein